MPHSVTSISLTQLCFGPAVLATSFKKRTLDRLTNYVNLRSSVKGLRHNCAGQAPASTCARQTTQGRWLLAGRHDVESIPQYRLHWFFKEHRSRLPCPKYMWTKVPECRHKTTGAKRKGSQPRIQPLSGSCTQASRSVSCSNPPNSVSLSKAIQDARMPHAGRACLLFAPSWISPA